MNIGEKMFTYIDVARDLTLSMITQYKNAMIVLGDEQQMFLPATGSYVGLGMSAYTYVLNKLNYSNNMAQGLDDHLHQNTVNSIYSNFAPEELKPLVPTTAEIIHIGGHDITMNNYKYQLQSNKDVVLKGIHDYNPATKAGMTVDELGRTINNPTSYGSSGITVNIQHNGTHVTGIDEYGFEYSYWSGQDYLTIDDELTWSYITARNTYLMNFAKDMAVQQANRIYHDILGTDVVYIEKEFDEAFLYDKYQNTLEQIKEVYIKMNDGHYENVEVKTDGQYWYVTQQGTDNILATNAPSAYPGGTILSSSNIQSLLSDNGGWEENEDGEIVPVWYHIDTAATASKNTNLSDGIQTIYEISYILDKLTDGDEEGINLAYNISYNYVEIQNLKKWQQNLGDNTVNSFQSESKNTLLTISYYASNLWGSDKDGAAVGNVKLDIDLTLAQTYLDENNQRHAAYLNSNHQGASAIYKWITNLDRTNINNYRQITSSNYNNIYQDFLDSGSTAATQIEYFQYNSSTGQFQRTGAVTSLSSSNLSAHVGDYVFWGKTKQQVNVEEGLTDVRWVTSYVAWTVQEILDQVQGVNDEVKDYIDDLIDSLDYTDSEVDGEYVSKVDEVDGKIIVTRKKLPLDVILNNELVYSNDMFLHINAEEAKEYLTQNSARTDIFELETGSGQLTLKTSLNAFDETNHYKYYIKRNLSKFIEVPQTTPVVDLIQNAGQSSYYVKTTLSDGQVNYTPIDVQLELTRQQYFDSNSLVLNSEEIYWLDLTSQYIKKYLDTHYVQHKDGHTDLSVTAYITPLQAASPTNTGFADAWNVRQTIESMFEWIDLKTNKVIGL